MRYTKSVSKLVYTGSRNLIDTQLRKRLQPKTPAKAKHNEYPILMMHGFMGFSEMKIFNITLSDIFFIFIQFIIYQLKYILR